MTAFLLKLMASQNFARGLAETLKVSAAIGLVLIGCWWLRYDAARDERRSAEAHCKTEIKRLEDVQEQRAEAAASAAEAAGSGVASVPYDDVRLRRLCDDDPTCRDRD